MIEFLLQLYEMASGTAVKEFKGRSLNIEDERCEYMNLSVEMDKNFTNVPVNNTTRR